MNYTWKSDLGTEKLPEFEQIKQMITLSVITLSGFNCTSKSLRKDYTHRFQRFPAMCNNGPRKLKCFP